MTRGLHATLSVVGRISTTFTFSQNRSFPRIVGRFHFQNCPQNWHVGNRSAQGLLISSRVSYNLDFFINLHSVGPDPGTSFKHRPPRSHRPVQYQATRSRPVSVMFIGRNPRADHTLLMCKGKIIMPPAPAPAPLCAPAASPCAVPSPAQTASSAPWQFSQSPCTPSHPVRLPPRPLAWSSARPLFEHT